jgi:energy-coupling factor transporter ATP-binding protein EcfA2
MTAARLTPVRVLDTDADELAEHIAQQVRYSIGRRPSGAEIRSWRFSLPALARDLLDAGLPHVEMLVEYQLPYTSKRADVVLAGIHPRSGVDSYVVVELKQWSGAKLEGGSDISVFVEGTGGPPRLHPVAQVREYCHYIRDFLGIFDTGSASVQGVAYLHNAADSDVRDLFSLEVDSNARLFTKDRRARLHEYCRSRFSGEVGAAAGDRFLQSAHRPSRKLIEVAAAEVKQREQFVLIDEQVIAFEKVMRAVDDARRGDTKEVIVITGGPGSGKSVIALSLLGELYRQGYGAIHATGSKSFTETMRRVVGKGNSRVKGLFKYFNSFMQAEKNSVEILICDEAHRIRQSSNNRFTKASRRSDRPQIAELVDSARVPVFLLDQFQVVKPDEIGTVHAISDYAASQSFPVRQIDLDAQFRCGGSRGYEEWVLRLLDLDGDGPVAWQGDENFQVQMAHSPEELESVIRGLDSEGQSARMSAGFCWRWSDPENGQLVRDVRIGTWAHPWNARSERAVGSAPPSSLWATESGGIDQVGCVYTAQGFEYDWSGVILGPDIVARDGRLVTLRSKNVDPAFKFKKIPDERVDRHIRNIYKVLLTRGMRGTVIYSVDEETREFLAKIIQTPQEGKA